MDPIKDNCKTYSDFFNKSLAVMLIIDPKSGQIMQANPSAVMFYGFSKEELLQKNISEINTLPPDLLKQEMDKALSEKRNYFVFVHKIADGSLRNVAVYSSPILLDDKKFLHSIVHDVTDRFQSEENLKIKGIKLQNIIDSTRAGTWEWNIQTGETIFNERWAEIIGYTLKEIGPTNISTWKKYTHPDDFKKSNDLLKEYFARKLPYYECECRMKHKNGKWVCVVDRGLVTSWSKDGKPLIMFGTHVDVTLQRMYKDNLLISFRV